MGICDEDCEVRTCRVCGVDISARPRNARYCGSKCKDRAPEKKARDRQYREKNKGRLRESNRVRMAELIKDNREEYNARMREWKRKNRDRVRLHRKRYAEKQGRMYDPSRKARGPEWRALKYDGNADMQRMKSLPARNAKEAFDYWIKVKAPAGWVARYFKAAGKPWANPRFTEAMQWKIKYRASKEYNIKEKLRRQIRKAKKRDGVGDLMRDAITRGGRSPTVEERLGYTVEDLIAHLEMQFTKGMTWEEFKAGNVHIDHIVPQSDFNTANDDEWQACWSLGNLRPAWAKDNMSKSAKRVYLL